MTASPTLRSLAGLPGEPAPLARSALVLIDCQNTYRQGVMQLHGVEAALAEAQKLLARTRDAGAPVIHIQHSAGPGSPYDIEAEIGQIADLVAPREGEPVVVKRFPNSFVQTDLQQRLEALGRDQVIFAGFMTHMCVNSTARGAYSLGHKSVVVGRATATRSLPRTDGGVIDAEALHQASLTALGDLFSQVVQNADDIPTR